MALQVTCAIIVDNRRVLCAQRGPSMALPFQWEFPGGKTESGESAEACIMREIKEELNLDVQVIEQGITARHVQPSGKHLELISFVCVPTGGTLSLQEHADARWCDNSEMASLKWAEADLQILEWWLTNADRIFSALNP